MEVLRFENVCKNYGELEAIKDLNFSCKEGEMFVILGPSGAGKTTTLKMISGLEEVTTGKIYIKDKLVNLLEPKDRNVSMVFEDYALYPHLTVYKNISSPLEAINLPKKEIDKKIKEITNVLQIEELLSRLPSMISGGQKQRVVLARSLVKSSNEYLMDEPIAHLDAKLRYRMRGEFKRLQILNKMNILYATNDFREAFSLGDRILVLNKGITQQVGTPKEIFLHPANTFIADLIGDPPTNLINGILKQSDGQYNFQVSNSDISIVLSNSLADKIINKTNQEKLILGVRPFDFNCYLGKKEGAKISKIEVYANEIISQYNIISVKLGNLIVKIREDKSFKVAMDEKISIDFEEDKVNFFDGISGEIVF
jgi:multiple sugar transport system ATP-binding protein